jgi:O-antigen ligase
MTAMPSPASTFRHVKNLGRMLLVAALGFAFSLCLYQTWDLDTRWFVVVAVGIVGVAVAMCLARIFSDFLLVATLFCLPLSSFHKWIWPSSYGEEERGNFVYSGVLGIGLIDFTLIGLYASWFYRIFITREQPLPTLNRLDFFVLWFLLAHFVSIIGSTDTELAFGASEFLLKHVLVYFYLSRNFQSKHLPWILLALGFAISVEAGLGGYQFATGKLLGIALDKGAGGSAMDYQYEVPGIEGYFRATGTSYDSHSLGHLVALMLPFPLVLCFTPRVKASLKLACLVLCGAALTTIVLSLSRAAWVSAAVAMLVGVILIVLIWQERQVVPALAAAVVLAGVLTPLMARFIYERFADSPYETLTTRFDQYIVGLQVFTYSPIFGFGPGNWTQVLKRYDFLWLPVLPIHNVMLWTATEIGLFGLIPYLAILGSAIMRLLRVVYRRRDIPARLSLAALLAMIVTVLNGLTDPTFREPNVFLMFWVLVSLSVALPRLPPGAGAILMAKPLPVRGMAAATA